MKTEATIKIKNVSAWEHTLYNPYIVFPPGEVVEVTYTIGERLIRQPEFEEEKPAPPKKTGKKGKKVKEEEVEECEIND